MNLRLILAPMLALLIVVAIFVATRTNDAHAGPTSTGPSVTCPTPPRLGPAVACVN